MGSVDSGSLDKPLDIGRARRCRVSQRVRTAPIFDSLRCLQALGLDPEQHQERLIVTRRSHRELVGVTHAADGLTVLHLSIEIVPIAWVSD